MGAMQIDFSKVTKVIFDGQEIDKLRLNNADIWEAPFPYIVKVKFNNSWWRQYNDCMNHDFKVIAEPKRVFDKFNFTLNQPDRQKQYYHCGSWKRYSHVFIYWLDWEGNFYYCAENSGFPHPYTLGDRNSETYRQQQIDNINAAINVREKGVGEYAINNSMTIKVEAKN